MITKKDLCHMIVNNYCALKECSSPNEKDIVQSSSLAVAMEYLDLIHDNKLKEYASSRGGSIVLGDTTFPPTGKFKTLSVRYLLELLPLETDEVKRKYG